MKKIVHLVTQRNQPYCSVRKCCEECGLMCGPYTETPLGHLWTDCIEDYNGIDETIFIRCSQKAAVE